MIKKDDKAKVRVDKRFDGWQRPGLYIYNKKTFVKSEVGEQELEKLKKMVGLN